MASFRFDQAEGLRRMVGGGSPRLLCVLSSAPPADKAALLLNLAASLTRAGSRVLLLDACGHRSGLAASLALDVPSLLEVAREQAALAAALHMLPEGVQLAALSPRSLKRALPQAERERLDDIFCQLVDSHDVLLVDAELDEDGAFLLPAMSAGEILVQAADSAAAITAAYGCIKRLHGQYGRRPVDVLVTGCDEARAGVVFRNMASAALRYLGVELRSLGSVPEDQELRQAMRLKRSVVDAFPLASTATAFRNLAGHYAGAPHAEASHV